MGWFRGLFNRVFGPGPQAPVNRQLPTTLPDDFMYPIVYIPGPAQMNALRNRGENDAALPFTQDEYNKTLNKFIGNPNVKDPLVMGEQEVKDNPKWVPGTNKEPKRTLSPSSSVISSIKLTPDNKIKLRFGTNPTEYTYNGGSSIQEAAQAVLDLINSPSIGRAVNTRLPGSWGRRHFDQGAGSLPPLAQNMNAGGAKYRKQ